MIAKHRYKVRALFIALLCCLSLNFGRAQGKEAGIIEGKVINERGRPVPQAKVYLGTMGATIGARRYVGTDDNGHFIMDRVPWGKYYVFARKDSAGYPDMGFAFYDNNGVPTASVSPSVPEAIVTVRVGPPCGLLKLTSITDAVSGRAVVDPVVTLRRASRPRIFQAFGFSSGPILVPSNTKILVGISAIGYEPWPAKAKETVLGKIHLRPGEVYSLSVKLQPLKKQHSK